MTILRVPPPRGPSLALFGIAMLLACAGIESGCSRRPVSPRAGTTGGDQRSATLGTGADAKAHAPPRPPRRRPNGPDPDALPDISAGPETPLERRAIQVVGDGERLVDADAAVRRGLTLVDLSDAWAPAVFADRPDAHGKPLPNRYRAVFTGLAADRRDGDGQPLAAGERNYLELYGVPPALSVLRRRFLEDAPPASDDARGGPPRSGDDSAPQNAGASLRTCPVDVTALLGVDEIRTWGATTEPKEMARARARAVRLEAARVAAGASDLGALADGNPRYARDVEEHRRFEAERAAFAQVEARLVCERLLVPARHKPGSYDTAMRAAVLAFQQKHALMDQGDLRLPTLEALARPPLENDFLDLRRVLTERAMHAGGFMEDGSVGESLSDPAYPTYRGADGNRHRVPDLATASLDAVLARLGIEGPDDATAFFRRHPAADFRWLKVAVRLPQPPEYYGRTMDLSAEIDRGDVWYDFPFDAHGVRQPQPRERYPTFTLYVKWRGERVPLVRWRTTVGGWRAELASDGQEYYRYKGSDVGPRVWRHIVAAPVWIPPPSSPLGSMVKEKRVNGAYVRVTNYDETGPGYLSAYGLVAAIHEEMRRGPNGPMFFDNGIRTHGSFDYMSLRGRFSHGCHRLYNAQAMRLFSYVLEHRRVRVIGDVPLGFRRSFFVSARAAGKTGGPTLPPGTPPPSANGEVFEMRLPTRGYYYELDPPLPIEVLEGRIKGALTKPMAGYVPKPGVKYASSRPPPAAVETPESRAGGEGQ